MTTHPPGHPSGPTGPGRAEPLPRFGEVVRDLERLYAQALAISERHVDRDSYPQGMAGHKADAGLEVIGFHTEAILRELGNMGALPSPPAGSTVPLPRRVPAEPGVAVAGPQMVSARRANPGVLGPTCDQGTPHGPCTMPRYHSPSLGHWARP
jgi:hypothetical protein